MGTELHFISYNKPKNSPAIMLGQVDDKKGNPINKGDTVFTKIRGGKRGGEVSEETTRTKLDDSI